MNEIIKKNGITFGVISGIASVLITTLLYVIDINLFASMAIGFSIILFYLIIGIYFVSKTKKDLKGTISFKEAFTVYFISGVIGILISTIFTILLFNVIDPGAKETLQEITIKSTVSMMQKFGAPQSEIVKAVDGIKKSDQFSAGGAFKSSITSIIFVAIYGLILGAIFKSKNTDYDKL